MLSHAGPRVTTRKATDVLLELGYIDAWALAALGETGQAREPGAVASRYRVAGE